MDQVFSMGGLLPLWILGAPLVAGLLALATLPKSQSRNEGRNIRARPPTATELNAALL